MVTASATINLVGIYVALKVLKCHYKEAVKVVMLPLIGTFTMASVVSVLRIYVFGDVGLTRFFLLVIIGMFMYLSVANLFDLLAGYGIKRLMKEQFAAMFKRRNGVEISN